MKYLRYIKNKQGLTLIEIMVTVLIAAIVLGMVASIVGFFSNFYSDESQYINRQENMRVLMLNLEKDIRMSDQKVNLSGSCYVIGLGDGTPATPIHTYCFDSGTGVVTRDGVVLAQNVQTFTLQLSGTNTRALAINIRMRQDSRGKIVKADYTVFLRQAGS